MLLEMVPESASYLQRTRLITALHMQTPGNVCTAYAFIAVLNLHF